MPAESPPAQLKDWFDEKRYQSLARELSALSKPFRKKVFLQSVLEGLEERTLMQRLHQCAVAVDTALPGSFREKVEVLYSLAPKIEHGFVAIFLSDFVASFGLHDFDFRSNRCVSSPNMARQSLPCGLSSWRIKSER